MIEKNKKCLSDITGHDLLDINIIDLFTPDFKMIWTYFYCTEIQLRLGTKFQNLDRPLQVVNLTACYFQSN